MGLAHSPPLPAVSGACFPLPAVCFSDSGSESKSGRLWNHCWESCTLWGWGGEGRREQPGLLGCTELYTPLRGSGELREEVGVRETFKRLLYPSRIGGELLGEYHGLYSRLLLRASARCP